MTGPAATEVLDAVVRVYFGVRRRAAEHLGALSLPQARVLSAIGDADDAPRMGELARRAGMSNRTLTPIVDALERARLLRRRVDPTDRRAVRVELTARGRARRDAVCAAHEALGASLVHPLTVAERRQLARLLGRIAEHLWT